MAREPGDQSRELALWAAQLAADKKAVDPVLIEVGKISVIADYFLILSGASTVQVHALSDYLMEQLKAAGQNLLRVEGYREGWWVLLDYGDLVIHIFQREAREFYNLERLWSKAPVTTAGGR
ncbi:MAG: ribosome silencing factor [Bacillota bacterium]